MSDNADYIAGIDGPEPEDHMLTVTMVGATFRPDEARSALKQLKIGDKVTLAADPHNEYDSTAVAVYYAHHHIGFIPKESNSALFAALMAGEEIEAEIIAFETSLKPVLEISFGDDEEQEYARAMLGPDKDNR